MVNARLKQSKKDECDDRENSITIKVPPMAVSIFSYTKSAPKASTNKKAKETAEKTAPVKKKAAKKDLKKELEENT